MIHARIVYFKLDFVFNVKIYKTEFWNFRIVYVNKDILKWVILILVWNVQIIVKLVNILRHIALVVMYNK